MFSRSVCERTRESVRSYASTACSSAMGETHAGNATQRESTRKRPRFMRPTPSRARSMRARRIPLATCRVPSRVHQGTDTRKPGGGSAHVRVGPARPRREVEAELLEDALSLDPEDVHPRSLRVVLEDHRQVLAARLVV